MSRLCASASNQYLSNANAVVSAYPFSVALWFKPTTLAAVGTLWTMNKLSDASGHYACRIYHDATGKVFMSADDGSAATSHGNASPLAVAGSWQHVAAVWNSATDRTIYFGGASSNSATSRAFPTGVNQTSMGEMIYNTSTLLQPYDGRLAHVAVWSVALSSGDVAALAASAIPTAVQNASLVSYAPLTGNTSPEPDSIWV